MKLINYLFNLIMKTVITFDGSTALKSKCRKILGKFYEENKQCFLMPDGKWHRVNNGKIFFDHENNQYTFSSLRMTKGIVGNDENGTLKLGYFTRNVARNVRYYNGMESLYVLDRSIVENLDVEECIGDSTFYPAGHGNIDKENPKRIYDFNYSVPINYRCGYRLNEITDTFNKYFKEEDFKHSFYKHLPEVSFGIEYETEDGKIPEDLMVRNGLIPVKDGSLRRENGYLPFEYTTTILSGKKGLQAIKKQCELLNKYCDKGISGSLHVHIGTLPRTKEYVNAIYLLSLNVQDELYSMFPKYYRNTSKFKPSGTDYCTPLTSIMTRKGDVEVNFERISRRICGYDGWNFREFGEEHPADPGNTSKWNVKSRYKIINLIPLIFGKSGTVEFRIHGSTFNHDKIVNWLYIISAITKFAEKYVNEINSTPNIISGITLSKILTDIYSDSHVLSSYLTQYVDYRKMLMDKHSANGDNIGETDVKEDSIEGFNHPVKSLVL